MNHENIFDRFESLEKFYDEIISKRYAKYNELLGSDKTYVNEAEYKNWIIRVKKLLEDSYGIESNLYKEFNASQVGYFSSNHEILTSQLKPVFDAAKSDLPYSSINKSNIINDSKSDLKLLTEVLSKFHPFCRQLSKRYNDRQAIEVRDEYDVQDLIHALLRIHFDDIRPEEFTPSYAGGASRQDFLLKKEKIVIEIKKTRKSLGAREIGEELIIDMNRYSAHPDCDTLICFVYDPDYWINNPKGLIADLESCTVDCNTRVIISQF